MAFTPTQIQANIAALRSTYLLLSQQGSPQTPPQATQDIYNILDNIYSLATLDQTGSFADGTVGAPSIAFTNYPTTGLYIIGANNIGVACSGAKVLDISSTGLGVTGAITATTTVTATTGIVSDSITELTAGKGVTMSKNIVRKNTLTSLNATGTITAAIVNGGGIKSTSAAPVTATLDTAVNIAAQIGAVQGTTIEFLVDNTAGANTVTVAVSAGIVAATPVITGGATLTVAASATQGIGIFRLVFSSASAAVLYRIG